MIAGSLYIKYGVTTKREWIFCVPQVGQADRCRFRWIVVIISMQRVIQEFSGAQNRSSPQERHTMLRIWNGSHWWGPEDDECGGTSCAFIWGNMSRQRWGMATGFGAVGVALVQVIIYITISIAWVSGFFSGAERSRLLYWSIYRFPFSSISPS